MQVSCHIVKLVLRNNALTTFHGIENLKSLEGLDVSYNIISNFSELEFLGCLPSLRSLWLEGNPLCCARWYRAQVFSFFTHPEKVSHTLYIFNFCNFFLLSFLIFNTSLFCMVDLLNHNICNKHFMILFAILCPCETYKLSLSLLFYAD